MPERPKAAQFPHVGALRRRLPGEEFRKRVLQHIGTVGGQQAPARLEFVVVAAHEDVDRIGFVELVVFHAVVAGHLPAEAVMEHGVPQPVHLLHRGFVEPRVATLRQQDLAHCLALPSH